MSVGIGSKSKLAYVVESAYGIFPASPSGVVLGILSENIQSTRNSFASQEISPNRQMQAVRSGNVAAMGDINVELSPNALGMFLKHMLCATSYAPVTDGAPSALAVAAYTRGTYVTASGRIYLCTRSGTTTSTTMTSSDFSEEKNGTAYFQYYGTTGTAKYTHTFTAGVTKPVGGFSMEREVYLDSGSQFFRYTGGRVNTFSLTVPQEGIVTCAMNLLFLDLDSTASSTIWTGTTAPADEPFSGAQCVLQVKPSGGAYADDFSLSNFSLNITNNFDANVYTVGQRRRRDLPEGTRVVTGSFTALFEDMTKFNYFANETVLSLLVTFNHLGMYLTLEIFSAKLTGGTPAPVIAGNGVVSAQFNFEAFTNGTKDIEVVLKNNTTTYV